MWQRPRGPLAKSILWLRWGEKFLLGIGSGSLNERWRDVCQAGAEELAKGVVALEDGERGIVERVAKNTDAQEVEGAIDWLIGASPLLTLLASGFLDVYPLDRLDGKKTKYGLSLSTWLVSIVTARKVLGVLPLTYLSPDVEFAGAEEEKADSGEASSGDDSTEEAGVGVSARAERVAEDGRKSRRVWELVQTSWR
jgi:hypothetical protein